VSHIRIELRVTVGTDAEHLATLRRHIVNAARDFGADEDTIADFELVVSELATNVIRHTAAEDLTVAFQRSESQWVLDVSDATDLSTLDQPEPDDPTSIDGRGLFIVQAVMDDVQLIDIADQRFVRCIKLAA